MLIKICGIQTIKTAQVAVEAGADFIGFVFAKSSRQITPKQAADIAKHIPATVKKVGVFVNEQTEVIENIAMTVGLDVIQFHGDESPAMVRELPYETIKAFSIDEVNQLEEKNYSSDYYLVESPPTIYRGGSGIPFDWKRTENLAIDSQKLLLAGGLNPENVNEAIAIVNPIGVDVSSGVETNGEKDPNKIKQFIANVKG